MSTQKNKYSVTIATKGNKKLYLSKRDEESGKDIELDLKGYEIKSL